MADIQNRQKLKFTKTETEYNMKSIRFLLLTITAMFIIIAALMIVLGISVYSHYHSFSFFYESAKSGRFLTPSLMCVFLGLALLLVTSFGFFGSLKQSTCMVNSYALMLLTILVVKLVVVVLAFTTEGSIIVNFIDVPVDHYTTDKEIQAEVDSLQTNLNCCGSLSYLDYISAEFTSNHSTVVVSKEVAGDLVTLVLPESCCATTGDIICGRLRSSGCKAALVSLIVQNASVLGVLGVSVMFIQLLGIVFALLLARCIRKLKSEKAFISWKIKEQMIAARQNNQKSVYIDTQKSSIA